MFVEISVEESMSTYFGLFAIILLASFWNEYNEKTFCLLPEKKVFIYICIWNLLKKLVKLDYPARYEFYNEPEIQIMIVIVSMFQLHEIL